MSDSNMLSPGGLVVGTAGHIDHGKTTLVHALTGIDTDTLQEEKRRGISIDLGFANLSMPGCPPISFIDVPGHERFIRNMLAGAAGIEAVLLIVAADESVKPQTVEHFEICRLLGIKRGIVVLTKADLAAPQQIEKTTRDVKALVAGSFLQGAAVLPVSATKGTGMDGLRHSLCLLSAARERRIDKSLFRLPVDRSFARKGFGAVVTGTLSSGSLNVGDMVEVHPQRLPARVRGLQVHRSPVASATAGQRVAVNLAGVEHTAIQRGHLLAPPNLLEATRIFDVTVDWLNPSETPTRRQEIFLHSGTSEVLGSVKMHAGSSSFARLRLKEPVLVLPGDRFVLRRPSPAATIAGGSVVDPFPPKRLNRAKTNARLLALRDAPNLAARLTILVSESQSGVALADLVRMTGVPESEIKSALGSVGEVVFTASGLVLSRSWIEQKRATLTRWLEDFHTKNAGAAGAPLSLARLGLEASLAEAVFSGFAGIRVQGDLVSLANHRAAFSPGDTQLMQKLEHAFRSAAFQPPSPSEAVQQSAGGKRGTELLEVLVKSQRLVRISGELIFHADVIIHICKSLAQHKGRRFSVPEFKSWMNISRKYAIPLLEYLDAQRVTRRDGDMRIVL